MKMYELFIALYGLPFVLFWFFLPESPRWLIGQGRFDEAKKVLAMACRMNGVPEKNVEMLDTTRNAESNPPRGVMTDLLKYPATRRNFLCMITCWFR